EVRDDVQLAAAEGDSRVGHVVPDERAAAQAARRALAEQLLVEVQRRIRLALLGIAREVRPVRGLRQPRGAGVVESERGALGRPRQRNAASVATVALAVRAEPRRILAELVGDLHRLGKAELLALVDVRR